VQESCFPVIKSGRSVVPVADLRNELLSLPGCLSIGCSSSKTRPRRASHSLAATARLTQQSLQHRALTASARRGETSSSWTPVAGTSRRQPCLKKCGRYASECMCECERCCVESKEQGSEVKNLVGYDVLKVLLGIDLRTLSTVQVKPASVLSNSCICGSGGGRCRTGHGHLRHGWQHRPGCVRSSQGIPG
jgi:hypothetical protein